MKKTITFPEWLRKVEKMSEREIEELTLNPKKYMRISRKYFQYIEKENG